MFATLRSGFIVHGLQCFFLLFEFDAQVKIYFSIRVKNLNNFKNKWPALGRK